MLRLFQTEVMYMLRPSDLAGTRAFLAEYFRLKTAAERRAKP